MFNARGMLGSVNEKFKTVSAALVRRRIQDVTFSCAIVGHERQARAIYSLRSSRVHRWPVHPVVLPKELTHGERRDEL